MIRTVFIALLIGPAPLLAQAGSRTSSDSLEWSRIDSLGKKGQIVIVARDARSGRPVSRPLVCIKENQGSSIPFWVGSPEGTYTFGGNAPAPIIHVRVLGPDHGSRDIVVKWAEAIGQQVVVPLHRLDKPREPECGW